MKNKKNIKLFGVLVLFVVIATLLLSVFYDTAFIPSCILMSSLFLFVVCYIIKDDKRSVMYILFIIGVLLIFIALGYTIKRLI